MSERHSYPAGVPCWVETIQADPEAGKRFYSELTLFRLPGYVGGEPDQPVPRDVVAVMMPADGTASRNVDVWVDDADATAAVAEKLGGSIVG